MSQRRKFVIEIRVLQFLLHLEPLNQQYKGLEIWLPDYMTGFFLLIPPLQKKYHQSLFFLNQNWGIDGSEIVGYISLFQFIFKN